MDHTTSLKATAIYTPTIRATEIEAKTITLYLDYLSPSLLLDPLDCRGNLMHQLPNMVNQPHTHIKEREEQRAKPITPSPPL